MTQNENIQELLELIQLPDCDIYIIIEILQEINKIYFQQEPIDNSSLAKLFFLTIKTIDERKISCDLTLTNLIKETFERIQSSYSKLDKNSSVYEILLNFLREIRLLPELYTEIEDPISIELNENFSKICELLEKISFIFRLKDAEDNFIFPINSLLSYFLIEEMNYEQLTQRQIYIFILAMELFDEVNQNRKKLEEFAKNHNIVWLSLLVNNQAERNNLSICKDNLIKNGTLVLKDIINNQIYIRNTKASYFDGKYKLNEETNSSGTSIAYFIQIPFPKNAKFISIKDIFLGDNLENKLDVLKYIYDEHCYNIFLEKSFYLDGTAIQVVNPYVNKDHYVVLPPEIGNNPIEKANNQTIFETLSFCGLSELWKSSEFDSILLKTLLEVFIYFPKLNMNNLIQIMSKKQRDLQKELFHYCFSNGTISEISSFVTNYFDKINYIKSKKNIEALKINDITYWPYKLPILKDSKEINQQLNNYFKIDYSFQNSTFIAVKPQFNFSGNLDCFITDSKKTISLSKVKYDESYQFSSDIYYMLKSNDLYYFSELISKFGRLSKKISDNNTECCELSYISQISQFQLDSIYQKMELQEKALCENVSGNKNTIFSLRLFHHLVYNQILDIRNFEIFVKLIEKHIPLKFDFIKNIIFESNTLYIPKNPKSTDSVLYKIYDVYIHKDSQRQYDIFNQELDFIEDYYCLNKTKINKIVFLFDNIEQGNATADTVLAYFGINPKRIEIQNYYCNGAIVDVKTLITKNKITDISILAFFGSECGMENVEKRICSLDNKIVLNKMKDLINSSSESFISKAKELYPDMDFCKDYFPIIREFNQPKKNIFSKSCLIASNIASIFVCKEELYILERQEVT